MVKIYFSLLLGFSLTSVGWSLIPAFQDYFKDPSFSNNLNYLNEKNYLNEPIDQKREAFEEGPKGITFQYAFSTAHSFPHSNIAQNEPNYKMDKDDFENHPSLKFSSFGPLPHYTRYQNYERKAQQLAKLTLPSFSRIPSFQFQNGAQSFEKSSQDLKLPLSPSSFSSPFTSTESPQLFSFSTPNTSNSHALPDFFSKNDGIFNKVKSKVKKSNLEPHFLKYLDNSRNFSKKYGYDDEDEYYDDSKFNDKGENENQAKHLKQNSTHLLSYYPKIKMVKVNMGYKNQIGKPWGSKTTFYYYDKKQPHNYMHLTKYNLNMNHQNYIDSSYFDNNFNQMLRAQIQKLERPPPSFFFSDNEQYDPNLDKVY